MFTLSGENTIRLSNDDLYCKKTFTNEEGHSFDSFCALKLTGKKEYAMIISLATQIGCMAQCNFCAYGNQTSINLSHEDLKLQIDSFYNTFTNDINKYTVTINTMGSGEPCLNWVALDPIVPYCFEEKHVAEFIVNTIGINLPNVYAKISMFALKYPGFNIDYNILGWGDDVRYSNMGNRKLPYYRMQAFNIQINKYNRYAKKKAIITMSPSDEMFLEYVKFIFIKRFDKAKMKLMPTFTKNGDNMELVKKYSDQFSSEIDLYIPSDFELGYYKYMYQG